MKKFKVMLLYEGYLKSKLTFYFSVSTRGMQTILVKGNLILGASAALWTYPAQASAANQLPWRLNYKFSPVRNEQCPTDLYFRHSVPMT